MILFSQSLNAKIFDDWVVGFEIAFILYQATQGKQLFATTMHEPRLRKWCSTRRFRQQKTVVFCTCRSSQANDAVVKKSLGGDAFYIMLSYAHAIKLAVYDKYAPTRRVRLAKLSMN